MDLKEKIESLQFKLEKIAAENDHIHKVNKILLDNSLLLKEKIEDLQYFLNETKDSTLVLSKDYINYFEKGDMVLLEKKVSNFEMILQKAILAGEFVENFAEKCKDYNATKPFTFSYANEHDGSTTKLRRMFRKIDPNLPTETEQIDFIQSKETKKKNLITDIFDKMQKRGKLPRYFVEKKMSNLEKLKLIRDNFQSKY